MAALVAESAPLTTPPPGPRNDRQRFFEGLARKYPVPPEWAKGPVHDRRRRVTDSIFFALFAGCLLLMGLNFLWAFSKSSDSGFTKVRDSSGNVCGVGAAKNYPFLYLQSHTAPYRSVCVRKCPSFDYAKINPAGLTAKNGSRKPEKAASRPVGFQEFSKKYAGRSHTHEEVLNESEAFEFPKYWANNRFTEQQWLNYLQNFTVECLPNQQFASCAQSSNFSVYDSYAAVRNVCVPLSPKAALLFNKVAARYRLGLAEDLRLLLPLLVRVAVFAFLLSVAFFAAVYGLPRLATAGFVALAATSLLGVTVLVFQGLYGHGALNDVYNPLRVKYLQFWIDNRFCTMIIGVTALLAAVLLVLYAVKHRRFLPLTSHMARLTVRQTLRNGLLVGLSVGILVAELGVFLLSVVTLARLCTTGKEIAPAAAPLTVYACPFYLKLMAGVQVLGTYWLLAVLEGLRDFVVGAVTVDFYFGAAISPLHVLCHTVGHHIGSFALLAMLAPVRLTRRWICGFMVLAGLAAGRRGTAWQGEGSRLCENFVCAPSRRSMTIVYLGSVGFWRGTRTVHALAETFSSYAGILLGVGDLAGFSARIAATLLSVFFGYCSYKRSIALQQNVDSLWVLWLGTGCLGYFVGSALHALFAQTHEAVVVCHLVQLELNRQGYNFQAGPRELQDALAEHNARAKGNYRAAA